MIPQSGYVSSDGSTRRGSPSKPIPKPLPPQVDWNPKPKMSSQDPVKHRSFRSNRLAFSDGELWGPRNNPKTGQYLVWGDALQDQRQAMSQQCDGFILGQHPWFNTLPHVFSNSPGNVDDDQLSIATRRSLSPRKTARVAPMKSYAPSKLLHHEEFAGRAVVTAPVGKFKVLPNIGGTDSDANGGATKACHTSIQALHGDSHYPVADNAAAPEVAADEQSLPPRPERQLPTDRISAPSDSPLGHTATLGLDCVPDNNNNNIQRTLGKHFVPVHFPLDTQREAEELDMGYKDTSRSKWPSLPRLDVTDDMLCPVKYVLSKKYLPNGSERVRMKKTKWRTIPKACTGFEDEALYEDEFKPEKRTKPKGGKVKIMRGDLWQRAFPPLPKHLQEFDTTPRGIDNANSVADPVIASN